MRLLAIDTALDACSVGVVDGDVTVSRTEIVGRGHAEILMGMIEAAMAEAKLAFADLDRIAVVVGPGSFTGLRVGIAAARGFALVTGKPAVGIGTLDVHAEEARALVGAKPVLVVNAAGRGDMYGAVFAADGGVVMPAAVGSAQIFAAHVTGEMVIAGSGADLVLAALPMDHLPAIVHRRASPDIAALCRLALRVAATGEAPRPLYLRPPDAKPQSAASRLAHR
jgi:tRNA threonylcarbamoyladenosine biosynthesis protein TsaB